METKKPVDLSRTDFYRANLSNADFSKADLFGANLSKIFVRKTNFLEAKVGDSIFAFSSLKDAVNLDKIIFVSPCSIDYQTLMQSGDLPLLFLRGCGIPDDFIESLPSLRNKPSQFYSCFISHSWADKPFARRLYDALQGKGIRCWFDEKQLRPGDPLYESIHEGITIYDKVILVCSRESLVSWWVEEELQTAFQKEIDFRKQHKKRIHTIIPVDVDGAIWDWKNDYLRDKVISKVVGDFQGWETDDAKFEASLEKVITALNTKPKPHPEPLLGKDI